MHRPKVFYPWRGFIRCILHLKSYFHKRIVRSVRNHYCMHFNGSNSFRKVKCLLIFALKISLKRSSVQIAATLRATWELLFWPPWSVVVDQTLILDEQSLPFAGILFYLEYYWSYQWCKDSAYQKLKHILFYWRKQRAKLLTLTVCQNQVLMSKPLLFQNIYRTTSVRAPPSISTPSRIVRTHSTRIL